MDIEKIRNLFILLPEEIRELYLLYDLWNSYKSKKDWFYADKVRAKLILWDKTLNTFEDWCPLFESNLNWKRRLWVRMITYKVSIYPYEYDEKAFEGLTKGTVLNFPLRPIES